MLRGELEIEQVGFSRSDQVELRTRLHHLRRVRPGLGIEAVALHPDGRVWLSFVGGRRQIAAAVEGLADEDRIFLFDRAEPHIYRND